MDLGTDTATTEYILHHLDEDLEELAQRSGTACIHPSLAPLLTPEGLLRSLEGAALSTHPPASAPRPLEDAVAPPGETNSPFFNLLLQVMSIKDVSLSREQRSRALVHALAGPTIASALQDAVHDPDDRDDGANAAAASTASLADATLQAMEAQQDEAAQQHTPLRPSGGQWRCLRLELSDGFQRIFAVEDSSARTRQLYGGVWAKDGVALGAKVRVRLPTSPSSSAMVVPRCVQCGVLRLHRGNTEILGGRVRALEVFWETQAQEQLAANKGRPSKRQQKAMCSPAPVATAVGAPSSSLLAALPPQAAAISPNTSASLDAAARTAAQGQQPQPVTAASPPQPPGSRKPELPPVQPLRRWPAHVLHQPLMPFRTVAYITEVVSDMIINDQPSASAGPAEDATAAFTYSLLVQLSAPNAVERETQQQLSHGTSSLSPEWNDVDDVCEDDHLTVDLGHAWLRQLVGMPAADFRALSFSSSDADVARLTQTVEAVGQTLERFGRGLFTLERRRGDGMVEVVHATAMR